MLSNGRHLQSRRDLHLEGEQQSFCTISTTNRQNQAKMMAMPSPFDLVLLNHFEIYPFHRRERPGSRFCD